MPPATRTTTTLGGWTIEVTLEDISLSPIPPLDRAPTSSVGIVSARARGIVHPGGRGTVHSASPTLGASVGRPLALDPDGATLRLGADPRVKADAGVGTSGPDAGIGADAGVAPEITTRIKPGATTEVTIGTKDFETPDGPGEPLLGGVSAVEIPIEVENCLAKPGLRLTARIEISTSLSNDAAVVYSQPITLR
jgi:hypothetical protein